MAHVGDSRAYLVRNGMIKRLTTDHTLVEKWSTAASSTTRPTPATPTAILTRSLGITQAVEIGILEPPLRIQPGDSLLMCSDGLTVYLDDQEILQVVSGNTPEKATTRPSSRQPTSGADGTTSPSSWSHQETGRSAAGGRENRAAYQPHRAAAGQPTPAALPVPSDRQGRTRGVRDVLGNLLFYAAYLAFMILYFYFYFNK